MIDWLLCRGEWAEIAKRSTNYRWRFTWLLFALLWLANLAMWIAVATQLLS